MATRWWLTVFGAACMVIGLAHLLIGPASIIGGGPVNATIDSDLRFYAVLFIGFGAGFVWAAADLPRRFALVNVLGGLFLLGGLARLLAIWQTGVPHAFYVLMIPVEIVVPVLNWMLLKRLR
ncbi:hypothetical protein BOO86_11025 [Mycobacterium sp. CBMA 234]|uniref:DUF4345 domain-containing protein n=1 Tax=Mycolicibacterium sp. CBMA 234 TaxID=1918495 RepID=UPI0012DEB8A3|nr:DUF4345 domain-containing protein [Mycolicibacterium sp. CBMA 234]MUL64996.1 hypothetical protein [Mycolicibacterium sp. CBMA 234]